jgi:hypothetical protein
MKKNIFLMLILLFSTQKIFAQSKKYCAFNSNGKYEVNLSNDGSHNALFNLYDNYGDIKKTTQGQWSIRDEGVYGAAYALTFVFTGKNSNLPSMKFICQYDGEGQLQALIDSQNRTWNLCR